MPETRLRHFLPALMGALRQQEAEGELVLDQNDGIRRMYWSGGDLRYLHSDAVGDQFGNFLIRRGVLDMAALRELLADGEGARVGDRVVQVGLMTQEERDARLHELLGSILLHALEHPVLKVTWLPGPLAGSLSGDLQFRLDHRRLVWDVFQTAQIDQELVQMILSEPAWRWQAPDDLLLGLSDLPLNPQIAYAVTLMGTEPFGCDTLSSLAGLPFPMAARLVASLWTLGGIRLVEGRLPLLPDANPEPPPAPPEPAREEPLRIQVAGMPAPPAPALEPFDGEIHPYSAEPLELDVAPDPVPSEPIAMAPAPEPAEESPTLRARKLFVKARSYLMQDRTSEAIRALEQSVKLDGDSPESYEAWLMLGRLRTTNPAWSTRAIEALQIASRVKPKAAEPWALMGELYHRKGFKANAQGCFRRALELDPSVAVPTDWADEDGQEPAGRDGQGGGLGLMNRLKSMLGREKG